MKVKILIRQSFHATAPMCDVQVKPCDVQSEAPSKESGSQGQCCWLLLVVVGCCWLLLVVVGCCWLLLVVVVVVGGGGGGGCCCCCCCCCFFLFFFLLLLLLLFKVTS